MNSSTGLIVPSAFETCETAAIFVRASRRFSNSSTGTSPESVIGTTTSFAPVRPQASCHGTMLEWCSSPVRRISSPFLQDRLREARGHEVDRLGRAAREDDFLRGPRAEEAGDLRAGAFVLGRRLLGEEVRPAVDVRVRLLVVAAVGVDDGTRLLRRVRVVEVDEPLAVHGLAEDRELLPDLLDVEGRARRRGRRSRGRRSWVHRLRRAGSQAWRRSSRRAFTSVAATLDTTSLPNAYVRRARAAPSERPRERR